MPDTTAPGRTVDQLKQLGLLREKWTAELQDLIGQSPDRALHLTEALEDLDCYMAILRAADDGRDASR